jgi:hypothetical protein
MEILESTCETFEEIPTVPDPFERVDFVQKDLRGVCRMSPEELFLKNLKSCWSSFEVSQAPELHLSLLWVEF